MNKFTQLFVAAIFGSGITLTVSKWYDSKNPSVVIEHKTESPVALASYQVKDGETTIPLDFTGTADKVTPAVVYVQSTRMEDSDSERFHNPFHDFFYNPSLPLRKRPRSARSSGSGVIISEKGYIVTNYHVVRGAEQVKITLSDNRTFEGEVVGTDRDTDIALVKIDKRGLPYLSFVDSDNTKVGQWVLAVGNPFNLNSTVTAGIISAKGRSINIINSGNRYQDDQQLGSTAIEAFIQTDAAINPGNSGGALVDLAGGLVGINTAIASPTGAYSGYGFAVPSNIAGKVVQDLISYGVVQRGWLGVSIQSVTSDLAKQEDLEELEGAYVTGFAENSAAEQAGVKKGDVIIQIDNLKIKSNTGLIEYIGTKRPGDKITVTVNRDGNTIAVPVVLKNKEGSIHVVKRKEKKTYELLGLHLETLNKKELKQFQIEQGVRVVDLNKGKLTRYTNMKKGFIITRVNNTSVGSVEAIRAILDKKKEGDVITFEGFYEGFPREYIYALRI